MGRPATVTVTVSGHARLVKRKRGDKWYARIRVGESQSQKLIGLAWTKRSAAPAGHLTKAQADARVEAMVEELRSGRAERASRGESGATFEDAATEYLRFVADVRKTGANTVKDYRGVVEGYLLDEFGRETPLERIDADAIDTYKERLIGEGKLSNRTIVRHLTVLHGIFKRAIRVWGLSSNPASAEKVERPTVTYTGAFETLERDEIDMLISVAETPRDATLYLVAAFTGLRTGELFALRWRDVDFIGGLLHVRLAWDYKQREEKVPKGKRARSVPMTPDVIDALGKLKDREHFAEEGDLVFCSDVGEHLDYYKHLARYKAALAKADLPAIRFHDLRHHFGTAGIQAWDAFKVQSYMGHAHYSTTQRYLHHKPQREDAAALAAVLAPSKPDPAPEPATR